MLFLTIYLAVIRAIASTQKVIAAGGVASIAIAGITGARCRSNIFQVHICNIVQVTGLTQQAQAEIGWLKAIIGRLTGTKRFSTIREVVVR